jgi:tRNA(His) 5'-end guanylyltransferase
MAALSYWLVVECGLTQQKAASKLGFRSHSTINRHLTRYWTL